MADGEPRNNFLKRAVTWNPGGVLNGARHITVGGYYLYITTAKGVAIVSVDTPKNPVLIAEIPLKDARSTALQFRYLFVTDAEGLKTIDVTGPEGAAPRAGQHHSNQERSARVRRKNLRVRCGGQRWCRDRRCGAAGANVRISTLYGRRQDHRMPMM